MFLLPMVREMTPSVDENHFHEFLRKAGFYLISRNPRLSPLDCLFGVWGLGVSFEPGKDGKEEAKRETAIFTVHPSLRLLSLSDCMPGICLGPKSLPYPLSHLADPAKPAI